MRDRMRWFGLSLACACVSGLMGCVSSGDYVARHRGEGTSGQIDLPVEQSRDVVTAWASLHRFSCSPQGEDSFKCGSRDLPLCLVSLHRLGPDQTEVKVLCLPDGSFTEGEIAGYRRKREPRLLAAIVQVGTNMRLRMKASPGVDKEELSAAVQAAVKGAMAERDIGPAAPVRSSDVDKPKYRQDEDPDRFAIVIGVERYKALPVAKYAVHDAAAMRSHLRALGVPQRNIFYSVDGDATRATLVKALRTWLPNRVNEESTVFFYYSGHGAPDPESRDAYLVPIDGDPEALGDTAYSLKSLYHSLGQLKAKQVLVALDSCFSGTGGRSVLASGTRPLVNKLNKPPMASGKIITLSASQDNQISGTVDEQSHGAFTYYFLKGLNGGAVDKNGSVTVQRLFNYLKPKVSDAARLHNRDQTPELTVGRKADPAFKFR